MNIILNYIVKNIKNNPKEELDIIQQLITEGKIDFQTQVQSPKTNSLISLEDFILELQKKEPFNDHIINFLHENKISTALTGHESFMQLILLLVSARFQSNEDFQTEWDKFRKQNHSSVDMLNYIKETYSSKPITIQDLFRYSFESAPCNISFIFTNIIENFLGMDSLNTIFETYLDENFIRISKDAQNVDRLINLFETHPHIAKMKLNNGFSLLEHSIIQFPDIHLNRIKNEKDKNKIVDLYYKEVTKVNSSLYIGKIECKDSDIATLLHKEEWFSTPIYNEDLLSVFIQNERKKEIILIALQKEAKEKKDLLKNYIINRENNLLIEYLTKNQEHPSIKEYRILAKKLPELLKRTANNKGILDTLIYGDYQIIRRRTDKYYEVINELPEAMMLTQSSEKLLNWINEAHFYDMSPNINDKKEMDVYNHLIKKTLSLIDKRIENNNNNQTTDDKLIEARNKLCIQYYIRSSINSSYTRVKSEPIQKIIEQFPLSIKGLQNFKLIDKLIIDNYLEEEYLPITIAKKEKDIISNILNDIKPRVAKRM